MESANLPSVLGDSRSKSRKALRRALANRSAATKRVCQVEPLEQRQLMAGDLPELTASLLNFYIADIDTDQAIVQVQDGYSVPAELLEGRNVTLFAEAKTDAIEHDIRSFRLEIPGITSKVENQSPYSITGDRRGDFRSSIDLGESVNLLANAFAKTNARGEELESADLSFVIEANPGRVFVDVTQLNDEILAANPGLLPAGASDGQDDLAAVDAAIEWLSDQLASGEADAATLYFPEGQFDFSESIQIDADIDVLGAGANQTRLTNLSDFAFSRADITDREMVLSSVNRAGYLIDFDKNADGASVRDIELLGQGLIGGVFAFKADDLEVSHTRFDTFLWSGFRSFNLQGSVIHSNEFVDAGGRKLKNNGSFGATGGGIFSTFHGSSEVYNNSLERSEDSEVNFYGIKGRKWTDSRIHHNTIDTNFSVELPFENDRSVEIDHNWFAGVVSIPKFAGGPVLEDEYSFRLHHNYFQTGYSIEGARNNLEVDNNVFEFSILADGGNLITNFGNQAVPGSTSFTNNLVVNPGRGIFTTGGVYNQLTFANNLIIANQTITPRQEGLIGLKAADNNGNETDFSTVTVKDNIVEVRGLERSLFRNEESFAANIENNALVGVSDAGQFGNAATGAAQGPLGSLQFHVGVGGEIFIDGDAIADEARNAELPTAADSDGDDVIDVYDPAPQDSRNGLHQLLGPGQSIELDFEVPDGTSPLDSSTGLTGINTNPDAVSTFYGFDPYGVLTSEDARIIDGMLEIYTNNGDSFGGRNDSADDYGFLFDATGSGSFTVSSRAVMPDAGFPQAGSAAIGMQIGDGSQENYIKFTRTYGGGTNRLELRWDDSDVKQDPSPGSSATSQFLGLTAEQAAATSYELALDIDRSNPDAITITPKAIAYDANDVQVGDAIQGITFQVTGKVAAAINGENASLPTISGEASSGGLFAGVYSTDYSNPFNKVPSFQARWEDLRVVSNDAFEDIYDNNSAYLRMYLIDADTKEILTEITDGLEIDSSLYPERNLTIAAYSQTPELGSEIGSVRLNVNGRSRLENSEEYNFRRHLNAGPQLLSMIIYTERNGDGRLLENFELQFTIV